MVGGKNTSVHLQVPCSIFRSPHLEELTTMQYLVILSALIVAISAQRLVVNQPEYPPIPYSFSYSADTEDGGRSAHEESGDGNGRVTGSYTVQGEGGFGRVVNYIADENGFRANIQTNEPGTANQNPADVVIESTAETQPLSPVRTAPVTRPVVPTNGRPGVRYILVPITDPRAQGYY
ncbi:cuticle protein 10.9 [Nephila pilipes]|uniref:Cuticle protein 10.9 n=1 Tax=Nephila pilipes TaxID=299642 RepID=A0A8X6INH6_NEPPI|nr:cuticle protein 10.9 [Nephila pilipes]